MVSSYGLLSSSRPRRVVYSPEYHDVQPSDIFEEAHEPVPRGPRLGRALSWEIVALAAISGAAHRPF